MPDHSAIPSPNEATSKDAGPAAVGSLFPLTSGRLAPGIWQIPTVPSDTASQVKSVGWHLLELDAAAVANKRDLLDKIALAGSFPSYFGANWDATADCLRDLAWLKASGYLMVVRNAGSFQRNQSQLSHVLLDVLSETSEYWARHGRPFNTLWESDETIADDDLPVAYLPSVNERLGSVSEWPTPST